MCVLSLGELWTWCFIGNLKEIYSISDLWIFLTVTHKQLRWSNIWKVCVLSDVFIFDLV